MHTAGNEEEGEVSSTIDIGKTNMANHGISDAIRFATPHHSTWGEDNAAMTAHNNHHAGRSSHKDIAPLPITPTGAITRRAITAAPSLSHRHPPPLPTTVTVESTDSMHVPSACVDSLLWKSKFNHLSLGVLAILLNLLLEGHHPTSHRRWRLLPPTPSDQPPP